VSRLLATTVRARDLKSDFDAANRTFGAAYDKGDAAAIARRYSPHAKVFPPDADIATRRDAIQKVWAGMVQSGLKITGLENRAIRRRRPRSLPVYRRSPDAQKRMTKLEGKDVVVWNGINGTWMLDSDIWNLNH
jgi:hypothetical protein